jgi:subtilisin family serine protease
MPENPQNPGSDPKDPAPSRTTDEDHRLREQLTRVTVPPELDIPANRSKWKLEDPHNDNRGPYLIELNVQYVGGLPGAAEVFLRLYQELFGKAQPSEPREDSFLYEDTSHEPAMIGKGYYRCYLQVKEWRRLIASDEEQARKQWRKDSSQELARFRCIYKLWPDFPVTGHISRSVATIKADAAYRSFEASGEGITWAVIDSGVQADHPHFGSGENHALRHPGVRQLHRTFGKVFRKAGSLSIPTRLASPDKDPQMENRGKLVEEHVRWALSDNYGHGTHVTGIITGHAPDVPLVVLEREAIIDPNHVESDELARRKETKEKPVSARERARFHGVAQDCRIISLRVLDENGEGRSSDVMRALEYIRETLNDNPRMLRVHGVNLSVGYEFDAEMFACGQSPLCNEVDRLVQSGVVVVTAAGHTGFGTVNAHTRPSKVGLSNTINDPGNAELAITVGATHRDSPHTYGVSYFSSKGPRAMAVSSRTSWPQANASSLVRRGKSCRMHWWSCPELLNRRRAHPRLRLNRRPQQRNPRLQTMRRLPGHRVPRPTPSAQPCAPCVSRADAKAYYVEDTGTSMAAPHVSGAIAAFLSIRREYIGRPLEVKRIFLESAMPLGRERYFEGHGLLDLMKAIQSV